MNHKESQATTYHNIGYTFYLKGDLDIAKEYYEKSLILFIELSLKHFVSTCTLNIGRIFYEKGEQIKAYEHFIKALAMQEEIGNDLETSYTLVSIIKLMIDLNDTEKSYYYIQKLRIIDEKSDNPIIHLQARLVEALKLKRAKRIAEITKAQEMFKQISNDKIYDYETTIFASFNLCEMLLAE